MGSIHGEFHQSRETHCLVDYTRYLLPPRMSRYKEGDAHGMFGESGSRHVQRATVQSAQLPPRDFADQSSCSIARRLRRDR